VIVYHSALKSWLMLSLFLGGFLCLSAQHSHQIQLKNDSEYYPVVKVSGFTPYYKKGGKVRKASNIERVRLVETFEYAPGFLQVGEYQARLNYYIDMKEFKELELDFPVLPSQDYKDNYGVIKLYTITGGSYFVAAALPTLKTDKVKMIRLLINVKYEVDEGHFQVSFFSGDKEIYHVQTGVDIRSKKPDEIRSLSRNDTQPELQNLGPPGKFQFEENSHRGEDRIKVKFRVNDKGFSFDHKVLESSSNDLARWVVKSLQHSSFGPGSNGGFYEEMPLTMEFVFVDGRLRDAEPVDA
jgi:hypothetical protein